MRTLLFCILTFGCMELSAWGQNTTVNSKSPKDTIVWITGKKTGALQVSVSSLDVSYVLPGHLDSTIRVDRKNVEKIIYKTGRIDVFNKPIFQMVDPNAWQAVTITKDKSQVEGMYVRGIISAKSSPHSRNKRSARRNTYIKLQRKASAIHASVVLITDEEEYGGFGDIPGFYIEGTAYGNQPLEKGTHVVEDKDKR